LLRQLQEQRGMAIMLITHNLGVIAEMADYVAVMYLGRVVEEGPVDDLFHAPRHPYTQALLRSIPSIESTPRVKLPTISGSVPHPYNRPSGCPFHPRCSDFMPGTCDQQEPSLLQLGERQKVSCFLYQDGRKVHGK
jgi:oligopeptide/dipeptide ABC transporter ATP-binding protein